MIGSDSGHFSNTASINLSEMIQNTLTSLYLVRCAMFVFGASKVNIILIKRPYNVFIYLKTFKKLFISGLISHLILYLGVKKIPLVQCRKWALKENGFKFCNPLTSLANFQFHLQNKTTQELNSVFFPLSFFNKQ